MKYQYAVEQESFEDFASGRVLFNMPGAAPLPVRLGCEVFERCRAILMNRGVEGPYTVYDPLCGGGYWLTVLGFRFAGQIGKILASDADISMITLATRNFSLLNMDGLSLRIQQIEKMIDEYGKESHIGALESALRLKAILEQRKNAVELDCFHANAMELGMEKNKVSEVDMVITDLPYGRLTEWAGEGERLDFPGKFLQSLHRVLPAHTIVAVVSDKKQKVSYDGFGRIEHFQAGKRQVTILGIESGPGE